MVPSIGIEPMTFPMSRERATAAPTGLKLFIVTAYFQRAHSLGAGTSFVLLALRQLGLNHFLQLKTTYLL